MDRVSKLRVEGGFYEKQIDIDLRTEKKHRVTTIYGGNGSGKSSIANAIFEYKHKDSLKENEFNDVRLLDDDSKELTSNEIDLNNIWVFSEKYNTENINWSSDSLGPIVMFGEQIEIDNEINLNKEILKNNKEEFNKINLDIYLDKSGLNSLSEAQEAIKIELRRNWSEREKKIKKTKTAPVTEKVLEEICSMKPGPSSNLSKLKNEFNKLRDEYLLVADDREKLVNFKIDMFPLDTLQEITGILRKKIEKPMGSTVENKLLNLVLDGKKNLIVESFDHFTHKDSSECPYCLQEVTSSHKAILLESISNILNEDVKNQTDELKMLLEIVKEISLDIDYLRKYKNDEVIEIFNEISNYNSLIINLHKVIKEKLENPFDPILVDNQVKKIINVMDNLVSKSKTLNDFVDDFNNSIDRIDEIKVKLLDMNKQIARNEIDVQFSRYNDLTKKYESDVLNKNKLEQSVKNLENEIRTLNAKKESVDIALEEINKNLFHIFSGSNRLKLEMGNDSNYVVKTRGKRVKLKQLSSGEKNVISLCYFFAHLRNNTDAFQKHKDPYFIVLDDPITSLDFDNKVGIYAFLRETISSIVSSNKQSRFVILTHDLEVLNNLETVYKDIKLSDVKTDFYCRRRILSNKETLAISKKNINSYAWNLETIYNYASKQEDELDSNEYYVGNTIRKTLEAYATFNYKSDITKMIQSDEIMNKIEDGELRSYFKNRMLRLILNSESHTENIAKSFTERDSFEQFSRREKIKLAKDVICLLYSLEPEHLKAYFKNDEKYINKIEGWINKCSHDYKSEIN